MPKKKRKVKKKTSDAAWKHPKFLVLGLVVIIVGLFAYSYLSSSAETCKTVATVSKGNLTAAKVAGKNEKITGDVNGSGCAIGVYIGSIVKNVNISATVHDANQYGIFNDGNVTVNDSEVYFIGHHEGDGNFAPNGSQGGVGIYFSTGSSASGTIKNSYIRSYQKGGIVINGRGTSANVTGNDVVGLSNVPFIAQNGIQFGYGARGNVMGNLVVGNWYDGANWTSTGILLFETGNVSVDKNKVLNNQTGVAVESWCWFEPSASNNNITNNTVSGARWGVSVGAVGFTGYSSCDALADNNKVTNNLVSNIFGVEEDGISIWTDDNDPNYTPSAKNNKVTANTVEGFIRPISQSGDTKSKVHANKVVEP
jgi:hypothetical protein